MEQNLRVRLKTALDLIDRQLTPGFYRGKPYQAPDVVVPQDIQIPELIAQKKYLDYLKRERQRVKAGKASKKPPARPYGQFNQQIAETGKNKTLAIAGPVKWFQLWPTNEDFGEEYKAIVSFNQPMITEHLNYINSLNAYSDSEQMLSNIEFESLLGSGSYGKVWRIRALVYDNETRVRTPEFLACKVVYIDPDITINANNPMFGRTLNPEKALNIFGDMLALRYVKHENICELVDVIGIPDTETGFPFAAYCLFFELMDGDLHHLIDSISHKSLSEPQIKHWFRQIAEAVGYCHKEHVVHRDIKTANIFYKKSLPNGRPVMDSTFKLGDFGISICYSANLSDSETNAFMRDKCSDVRQLAMSCLESMFGPKRTDWPNYHNLNDQQFAQQFYVSLDFANLFNRMMFSKPPISIEVVLAHKWIN